MIIKNRKVLKLICLFLAVWFCGITPHVIFSGIFGVGLLDYFFQWNTQMSSINLVIDTLNNRNIPEEINLAKSYLYLKSGTALLTYSFLMTAGLIISQSVVRLITKKKEIKEIKELEHEEFNFFNK